MNEDPNLSSNPNSNSSPNLDQNYQRPVTRSRRDGSFGLIAQRVVYYIGGVIIAFLSARVILLLLAANKDNGFVDFVYSVGGAFAQPFYGIFSYQPAYASSTFELSSIIAIIVYGLVTVGLARLFTIGSGREV